MTCAPAGRLSTARRTGPSSIGASGTAGSPIRGVAREEIGERRPHRSGSRRMPGWIVGNGVGRNDRLDAWIELVGACRPVKILGLPAGNRGVVPGNADQRIGPRRARRIDVQSVLHELPVQLGFPEQVEQGRVVENELVAGYRYGVWARATDRILWPVDELFEGMGVARVVLHLGNLGRTLG
jgi:hypothetical protein